MKKLTAILVGWGLSQFAAYAVIGALILGAILAVILILANFLGSCRENRNRDELNEIHTEQSDKQAGIEVINQQRANGNLEVKETDKQIVNTNLELQNSLKKDSSEFSGKDAENRFCSKFCEDISCREWRKFHSCRGN